jgi:hypothetical protein
MAETPRDRVTRLLAVARRIAAPTEALGREARARLLTQGILSAEGIELALSRHLETSVDETSLARLLTTAEPAPRCHVLLSANVCTGALRALALGLAGAPQVLVRPSRRDPVLASLFARELPELVTCVSTLAPLPGELVFVYGRDETIAEVAASLPEGVRLRAHGAGFGLAVIEAEDDLALSAEQVAEDVVPFDQAGCLSPRIVLVAGDTPRALAFAEHLHGALGRLGERVPRGPLDAALAAAISGYRATLSALGEIFEGPQHLVSVRVEGPLVLLPPAARVVLVAAASAASVVGDVAPFARFVTAVGARRGAVSDALSALTPHARRSALGAMQRPPLDGPVDLRPLGSSTISRCAAIGAEQG